MSVCVFVRLSVCLSVCVFTFEVPFNGLLPPLPKVGCPVFLKIQNPWGKVVERSGLRYEHFCLKIIKNCRAKNKFFSSHFFSLLRYRLTVFLPPFPKVGSPIFLEIRNPWGKVMERSGLRSEHFSLKIVENRRAKFFLLFFTFEVQFNSLFAPTFRSWMSNIFRDSESLGKSNGKKWSNIWTFLFGSGLKLPRKRIFFCWFCLGPPSYGIGATIRISREMLCLPYAWF